MPHSVGVAVLVGTSRAGLEPRSVLGLGHARINREVGHTRSSEVVLGEWNLWEMRGVILQKYIAAQNRSGRFTHQGEEHLVSTQTQTQTQIPGTRTKTQNQKRGS